MSPDIEKTFRELVDATDEIANEEDKEAVQAVVTQLVNVMMCEEDDDSGDQE